MGNRIDSLLDSLDTVVGEKLWQAEILRRAREIDEGPVQIVPWSELRSQLGLPI
jgi:putative addiction module component (TIGR02574 family)